MNRTYLRGDMYYENRRMVLSLPGLHSVLLSGST